jgi:hypothetical protein
MKIFPNKNQWTNWTLPSKATYVAVWLAVIALILTILGLIIVQKYKVEGDYVSGNKVSYNTYVTHYANKDQESDIVSDATLLAFFHRYSSAFSQTINRVPTELLEDLPGFLKRPYNVNVVVSKCHGVGFEYTVPSNNPEVTLIQTTAPIEKHFFTNYTNHSDFPISSKFIKISEKDMLISNFNIVGSKQVFWVIENADLQVTDIGIRYSEDEELKTIDYLWLFGSNTDDYWSQKDPVQLANENAIRLIKMYIGRREAEASYSRYKKSNN